MIRRVQQHADPAAQQVDRGLEPRRQHQAGDRPQLGAVQPDTVLGDLDELAHQIRAGLCLQSRQVRLQPAAEAVQAALDTLELGETQPGNPDWGSQFAELQHQGTVGLGTPRMSLMIATGSWEQYRSTMSTTSGAASSRSSSVAAVRSTPSRSPATARDVNTAETVLR